MTVRPLATKEDVKGGYLTGTFREADDVFLDTLLRACSHRIARITERHFFPSPDLVPGEGDAPATDTADPITKTFTVPRSGNVRVPDLRVLSSITLGGVSLVNSPDVAAYELSGRDGEPWTYVKVLRQPVAGQPQSYLTRGNPGTTLSITGRWGFLEVPDDIKDACCMWVARRFKQRDANYSDRVEQGIESAAFTYFSKVPEDIKMTLESYQAKRVLIGLI